MLVGTRSARRLGFLAAGVLVAALGATAAAATPGADHTSDGRVKHVIMFIGDGMQLESDIAASRYLTGTDSGLSFQHLPYTANIATWDVTTYNRYGSLRSPQVSYDPAAIDPLVGYDPARGGSQPYPLQAVPDPGYFLNYIPPVNKEPATDSASSATAYSTGHKTDDGNIAWLPGDPAGGALPTIAERVRAERGMAIGVVTTVPFDHATPASFLAHNVNRDNYQALGEEIINQTEPDVVIGGGSPLLRTGAGKYNYIAQPTYDALASGANPDYVFVQRATGVNGADALRAAAAQAAASGKKLFGLYGAADGTIDSPVPSDTPGAPSVRPGSLENPTLKDSTLAALDVVSRDDDGFFLMVEQGDIDTANHNNDFSRMVGNVWDLDQAVRAATDYVNRPGDDITWNNTLMLVTADHANSYLRLNPDKPLGIGDLPAKPTAACALFCVYPGGEVSYATKNHTNELVQVYAMGRGIPAFAGYEGTWYPGTGIIDNTQVFQALARVTGLRGNYPAARS